MAENHITLLRLDELIQVFCNEATHQQYQCICGNYLEQTHSSIVYEGAGVLCDLCDDEIKQTVV